MNTDFYLYVRRSGYRSTVRVTKSKGNVMSDEVVIAINLDIPDALFSKPSLVANITIPKDSIPEVIKTESINAIKEAVTKAVALKIEFHTEDLPQMESKDEVDQEPI